MLCTRVTNPPDLWTLIPLGSTAIVTGSLETLSDKDGLSVNIRLLIQE
ncbi:MAG: hypothetical protein QXQ28_01935 [Candidatus Nezhaarchaeales archaeon]